MSSVGESTRPPAADPPLPSSPRVVSGTVERVTYADERTLYTVLRVAPDTEVELPLEGRLFRPRTLAAVGRAPTPAEGQRVRLTGDFEVHATHGLQFAFDTLEVLFPRSEPGLVKYLASSAFEGIGEVLARRIVKRLGEDTLQRIATDADALKGIRGLRRPVAEQLVEQVRIEIGAHETHAFLRGLGLGPGQAATVIAELGAHCEAKVREDPYILSELVEGIGFQTADRAASALGIAPDDPRRLRAVLLLALRRAADEGHTLLSSERLLAEASATLGGNATPEELAGALAEQARRGRIVVERSGAEERAYLPGLARAESELALGLARLVSGSPARPYAGEAALAEAEERAGLALDPEQRAAVLGLLRTPLGLLTGGPGVGKTTIVRLVVELAVASGARVALASPTGRAAKRLAEATGREAKTIHRLLGYDPTKRGFQHDSANPLECDLLVVDEVSMLDVSLAHRLVDALEPPARLVLVGDPDQLPSVGPGNVLSDVIASGRVELFRLTRIYRQSRGSLIVENAHRLLHGEPPVFPPPRTRDADFYFFPADDPRAAADRLIEVVTRRIPDVFGMDWVRDVQVIAPMYRGECGVDALNDRLREALGAGGLELVRGAQRWRVGDRVIHTRNDYDKEVFNGDMGRIKEIDPAGTLVVAYPEREVVYDGSSLSDLQPAFAITVHRSQGGEFPAVVIPLVTQHAVMLQRNLLYTAITRARSLLVLVGSQRALRMAIDNVEQSRRESALAEKLRAALPGPPEERPGPERETRDPHA